MVVLACILCEQIEKKLLLGRQSVCARVTALLVRMLSTFATKSAQHGVKLRMSDCLPSIEELNVETV